MSNAPNGLELYSALLSAVQSCAGFNSRAICRAVNLASKEMGVTYQCGKFAIQCARFGSPDKMIEFCSTAKPAWGFVYVASAPSMSGFKIGFTRDVARRTASLQSRLKQPVLVHGCVSGLMLHEHAVHCHFSHKRIIGEWFSFQSASEAFGAINDFVSSIQ